MKLSTGAIASCVALISSASAFGGFQSSAFNGRRTIALPTTGASTYSRSAVCMSLSDLEDKLLRGGSTPAKSFAIAPKTPAPAPPAPAPVPKTKLVLPTTTKTTTTKTVAPTPKVSPLPLYDRQFIAPTPKVSPKQVGPPSTSPKSVKEAAPAEPANVPLGVALGAVPLAVLPLLALAAGRGALTNTVARRGQIQKEIEAIQAKKKAKFSPPTDAGRLAKALGLLGGAGASLGLILTAPFAGIQEGAKTAEAPKSVKPAVTKTVTLKKVKVESKAQKTPVPQATGGIAARTFARKAAADAKVAEAKEEAAKAIEKKASANAAEKLKTAQEADATEKLAKSLLEKAEKDVAAKEEAAKAAEAKAIAAKTPAAKVKATAIAVEKDEVALAAEAREKAFKATAEKAEANANAKDKAAIDAELKEQAAKKKEAAAAAEAAAKEKIAADAATKVLLQEKAAAEAAAKAKAASEAAARPALNDESTAKVAPIPSGIPTKGSGLGVVSEGAPGGRVLPAETLDLSTLDFLKKK